MELSEGQTWNKIVVELAHPDMKPLKGTDESAGYDLKSNETFTLYSGERRLIDLGFKMMLPRGWYSQLFPRSGLANKFGIMVMAGVIDNDYRGDMKALLYNSGSHPWEVERGERIIQMVLLPYGNYDLLEGNVSGTARGSGGFGSTGK